MTDAFEAHARAEDLSRDYAWLKELVDEYGTQPVRDPATGALRFPVPEGDDK